MDLKSTVIFSKYSWQQAGNTAVTGFAWLGEKCLRGYDLAAAIEESCSTFDEFLAMSAKLNGQFSVLVKQPGEYWLTSGIDWSFPLFYKEEQSGFLLSDDPQNLIRENKFTPDGFSESYFRTFGVSPGNQTLNPQIRQLMPGEILRLKIDSRESYSVLDEWLPKTHANQSASKEDLKDLFFRVFKRYSALIGQRQVLLPLTGGYDSRLLACLLKEFGHTQVICATWGRQGSHEEKVARRVAQQLGYDYHFIAYDGIVPDNFANDPDFQAYIHKSGHWSSMPYLQDFFAVQYLKSQKLVDETTVVLPGHPGDFLRGAHLEDRFQSLNNHQLIARIYQKFGTSLRLRSRDSQAVNEFIQLEYFKLPGKEPWKAFDHWDLIERQCKFIANSTAAFRFFKLPALMPLFDQDVIRFFGQLPFSQRLDSNLYNSCLEEEFFTPLEVDFNLKTKAKTATNQTFKDWILRQTPAFLKHWYYPMQDAIYYQEMTGLLRKSTPNAHYSKPVKPHFYNAYLVQWYLHQLKT